MSRLNHQRRSCKDVFNAFLVHFARYAGLFEFPVINGCGEVPNKLVAFSKSISSSDTDSWVHFYEDDYLFERLWRNPKRYLRNLKRFNGVILPDFSVYRDMPFIMQLWNIYRSRAIGCWLQENGVAVIPNIRFGDSRTYQCCCDGISRHSTVAIGTHGVVKCREDRRFLEEGLAAIVKRLDPRTLVVYGSTPDAIFARYRQMGIRVVQFDSDFAATHRKAL